MNQAFHFRDKISVQVDPAEKDLVARLTRHPWFELNAERPPQLIFARRPMDKKLPATAAVYLDGEVGTLFIPEVCHTELKDNTVRCPHPVTAVLATLILPLHARYGVKGIQATVLLPADGSPSIELLDNILPSAPEEHSRILGELNELLAAGVELVSLTCLRVPMAAGFLVSAVLDFVEEVSLDEVRAIWRDLRSAVEIHQEASYPQPRLHSHAVSVGQLKADQKSRVSFVATGPGIAHNALVVAEFMVTAGLVFW